MLSLLEGSKLSSKYCTPICDVVNPIMGEEISQRLYIRNPKAAYVKLVRELSLKTLKHNDRHVARCKPAERRQLL
jgi:hypothetical protein